MKRIILVHGLIAGIIVTIMFLISMPLVDNGTITFDNAMWVGYTSMVIALSTIFFGVKTYRDDYQSGSISFGKAFSVGLLIALIASVIYVISWEVMYHVRYSDFYDKYTEHYLEQMQKEGVSGAELEKAKAEMNEWNALYKIPLVRYGMTMMEIFPVGLVISLIVAAILRRRAVVTA